MPTVASHRATSSCVPIGHLGNARANASWARSCASSGSPTMNVMRRWSQGIWTLNAASRSLASTAVSGVVTVANFSILVRLTSEVPQLLQEGFPRACRPGQWSLDQARHHDRACGLRCLKSCATSDGPAPGRTAAGTRAGPLQTRTVTTTAARGSLRLHTSGSRSCHPPEAQGTGGLCRGQSDGHFSAEFEAGTGYEESNIARQINSQLDAYGVESERTRTLGFGSLRVECFLDRVDCVDKVREVELVDDYRMLPGGRLLRGRRRSVKPEVATERGQIEAEVVELRGLLLRGRGSDSSWQRGRRDDQGPTTDNGRSDQVELTEISSWHHRPPPGGGCATGGATRTARAASNAAVPLFSTRKQDRAAYRLPASVHASRPAPTTRWGD